MLSLEILVIVHANYLTSSGGVLYWVFINLTKYNIFMQAINSLKNVDSAALLQFLQPILNMLLHLIGDGGETLQVVNEGELMFSCTLVVVMYLSYIVIWLHCCTNVLVLTA